MVYDFEEFREMCGTKPSMIFVRGKALDTADRDFLISTAIQLKAYIHYGFMEDLHFKKTKPLEKTQLDPPPLVDDYDFRSGQKMGYFAYYRMKNGQWVIKSFKKNKDYDRKIYYSCSPIRDAITKANIKFLEKKGVEDDE